MLKTFIQRPVLATVISSILVILGILGMLNLPLERFPDIAPPAVKVTAIYPGANAETLLRSVAPSLEEAINGVDNMTYISSVASNDGSLVISVFFASGTNPDQAAVNVQNRVSQATSQLPPEVVQRGIVTAKQENSLMMVHTLISDDSARYDQKFLVNFANINIIPNLKRIQGVGGVDIVGGDKQYSMRVWLKPNQMATYRLSTQDVLDAINDQNLEAAPGKFGEDSKEAFEYVIKYDGKLNRVGDYEEMVIRANPDGSFLRLKDVARIEFGSYTYNSENTFNGKPAISIAITQLPGSNANDIQVKARAFLAEIGKGYPKGIRNYNIYNTKDALDTSIDQVEHTLLEAFGLVFLVVFIFLQDIRSTLIPAIAVPVAIIGTFFFMQVLGFTINLLTLFALVLAIGIVVDDAIVVVEAVHSKMERQGMGPQDATISAMGEITGAIISITLVMAAVFLPIGLIKGSTGLFYRQFAFTLAIAIVISAVNALTLSPALCALILRDIHKDGEAAAPRGFKGFKARFFAVFNVTFTYLVDKYVNSLSVLIRKKWLTLGVLVVMGFITVTLIQRTKTGFVPTEDVQFLAIAVNMQPGASLNRMKQLTDESMKALRAMPQVRGVNVLTGFNFLTFSNSPSSSQIFIILKPVEERGPVHDIPGIMALTREKMATVKGIDFFVFEFPSVAGYSNVDGLDIVLQDKTGDAKLDKFSGIATGFMDSLMHRKEIGVAFTTFRSDYPQFKVEVDKFKAKQLGVSIRDALQTMETYFGSVQASDFNRFGKYYRVVAQADAADRHDPSTLQGIYVKNNKGEMLPINTFVKLKRVYGPETATRYNLFNSIEVTALPGKGYSSGDAIKVVQDVASKVLPEGYGYEWSGLTREQISAGNQGVFVFGLCLLFVYFLLAAQYESYILPFAVILSIPNGLFGVFVAIRLAGIENNIYVQIALIMLIGLLSKNAILIVEFAVQRRRAGHPIVKAAIEAAALRIRPIIMTSFAFVVGLIPMMRAVGPSANGNHSISIAAAGGMLSGIMMGLSFIPVLFVLFQTLQEKISSKRPPVVSESGGISGPGFIGGSGGRGGGGGGGLPVPVVTVALLTVMTIGLIGCRVSKDVPLPDGVVPAVYRGGLTDTVSVASLPWQGYFTDERLKALIADALAHNNDMQVAVKNIESARLQLLQAKLGNLPAVDVAAGVSLQRPSDNSLNGLTLKDFLSTNHIEDYTVNASVSWEADLWGKIRSKKAGALAAYLQTEEARKLLQTSIVSDLAKGYYNLLLLDEELAIARRNVRLNDSTLNIIGIQFRSGQATSVAVQQAKAQQLSAAALIPQFEQQVVLQEDAIAVLSGRTPAEIKRDVVLGSVVIADTLAAGVPADLIRLRPDVRVSELALSRANAEVGYAKANMYPSLTITAQGGVDAFKASNWFNIPASLFGAVAGGLTQPLFRRREFRTKYEVSKISRDQTVLQFRQSVLVAVAEVSDALARLDKLKTQQAIMAERTGTLEEATHHSQLLYSNGIANYLEVITAQGNVLQSELDLAGVIKARLDATVDLYRSVGGGWN
jgi:HAE1 family hydrophobic/amphiphilic exporter-1